MTTRQYRKLPYVPTQGTPRGVPVEVVTATQDYTCMDCRRTIHAGERYGVDHCEETRYSVHYCLDCCQETNPAPPPVRSLWSRLPATLEPAR